MPTAILNLVREAKYLVVCFEPISLVEAIVEKVEYVAGAKLPEGLFAFSEPGLTRSGERVALRLHKDRESDVDCTPVLVAADYLRECGWNVILPKWVK